MAGMGKRMRPHTLTIPKPLIPIAGKSIVERLVDELSKISNTKIEEIAFVVGNFGLEVEESLIAIAQKYNAKGKIFYQHNPLGTAHAVFCAAESLSGEIIVAFADTLFTADFVINPDTDASIWVKKVPDPSAYGVVKVNDEGIITDFIEKPKSFISDLAIIGIYYFKNGLILSEEIRFLIENDIKGNNEYQLTDALEIMKNKGIRFSTALVDEWLDCGNKNATVHTNQRVLINSDLKDLIDPSARIENSIILSPSYLGKGVEISNSVIGPFVSVGEGTKIVNSIVKNSIIQNHSSIENANAINSMIGNYVEVTSNPEEYNIGDYTVIGK